MSLQGLVRLGAGGDEAVGQGKLQAQRQRLMPQDLYPTPTLFAGAMVAGGVGRSSFTVSRHRSREWSGSGVIWAMGTEEPLACGDARRCWRPSTT